MNVIEDIVFSDWQWITIFFSFIAIFAMIVGRYPIKTTVFSGLIACLINFAIVSFFIYLNVSSEQNTEMIEPQEEVKIEERLNEVFEENKGQTINEELVALVEPIKMDDSPALHVYVKNFHPSLAFNGKVKVAIFNEDQQVLNDEVFDITLEAGETKQIDSNFGDPHFSWFQYEFYPEEN